MLIFSNEKSIDKNDFIKPKEGEYIFLLVKINCNDDKNYFLTKQSDKVLPGDSVEVPIIDLDMNNNKTCIAEVISKKIYNKDNAPQPIAKTKNIIRVLRDIPRNNGHLNDLNSYDTLEIIYQIENIIDEVKEYVIRKSLSKSKADYKNDPRYEIEKKHVEEEFQSGLGFCHTFWSYQKSFLKEEYNIDWLDPSECNRFVRFD